MNTNGNKRFQETERKIQFAFEALLSEKRFHAITVHDICKEAGISRPSFYAHYEDINDMIMQMEREKGAQIQKILISHERLTIESFEAYFMFLKQNRGFYSAYLETPVASSVAGDLMDTFIHTRNVPKSERTQYQMVFLMAGIRAVAYAWLMQGCETPVNVLAQIVYEQYSDTLD